MDRTLIIQNRLDDHQVIAAGRRARMISAKERLNSYPPEIDAYFGLAQNRAGLVAPEHVRSAGSHLPVGLADIEPRMSFDMKAASAHVSDLGAASGQAFATLPVFCNLNVKPAGFSSSVDALAAHITSKPVAEASIDACSAR